MLQTLIILGTVHTKQDILDYLTWTYFFRRLLQNPSYYKLETLEPQDINRYLSNLVQTALDTLAAASCIEFHEVKLLSRLFFICLVCVFQKKKFFQDGRTISSTWMGRISSYYYLSHQTMKHFTDKLNSELELDEMLRVLSDAHEYNELPVRHNEDIMNG